ncbi:protease complex subunit PrcB family protein [Clostridium sp. YIM B02515]|uniref:Protease complex subunit PrcB family protein n=1 Tax=Clostridium rhizosphaerae TaxID=2803861 RepID=A0ABS1TBL6_9CLOT|nr:protease complex subunit PrcB family protein [Clostridium rhizosphaerae]MBL4936735.1 protease complex subunit PrcB family protein [Clostridium rhizosphaerae]
MKRYKKIFALIIVLSLLAGCNKTPIQNVKSNSQINNDTASAKEPGKNENSSNETKKGITMNKISFEEVSAGNLPSNLDTSIKVLKANRGYLITEYNDWYYITVFSGKKSTGGYSIKVLSVEDNEGKTNIVVEEKSPKQQDIVTQAITYPYTVVKLKGITPNITIKNTKGETLEKVLKEEQMY